jgi:hypothetical protein
MKKAHVLFIMFFIGLMIIKAQDNVNALIKALPEMENGNYKGTFLNDSLVNTFLNEYIDEAEIRGINIKPYIEQINWILIEPKASDNCSELIGMNLGKIDKEHKLILLSRNCLLDRFILKSTLFRELSHYLGMPYKNVDYGIMSLNKEKGYSYAWLDDHQIREQQYDDLFKELRKYLN